MYPMFYLNGNMECTPSFFKNKNHYPYGNPCSIPIGQHDQKNIFRLFRSYFQYYCYLWPESKGQGRNTIQVLRFNNVNFKATWVKK